MGKKKKKSIAENIIDVLNVGEQLLRHGEVRMNRKVVVNMDELTKPSIDGTVGSRIDLLEDKSDVLLDVEPVLRVNAVNDDLMHHYHIWTQIESSINNEVLQPAQVDAKRIPPTLVIMLPHKHAFDGFSLYDSTPLSMLMRSSNLPLVTRAIGKNWRKLIEENEGADCILYVPELVYFGGKGALINTENRFNLLVYVTRKKRYIYEEDDMNRNSSPQKELVHNVMSAAVKLNCSRLILDPLDHPLLQADPYETVDAWKEEEVDPTIKTNITDLKYCIANEDDYIIFWRGRK